MMALALALTGCKDAKNNSETAEPQQTGEKQEQNVKNEEAQEGNILEADDTTVQKADEEKATKPEQAKDTKPMVYCISDDGFLNIREFPIASSKILGKLLTGGEGAEYLASSGNWYFVRLKGTVGYVNSKYAKLVGLEESSMKVSGADKKVFYVVVGTYESLDEAKKAMIVQPDALDGSNVYRAKDKNGRTVFRMCPGCYYSRAEAQEQVQALNEYLGIKSWIWESDGVAPCVYQGIGLNGEPSQIGPE